MYSSIWLKAYLLFGRVLNLVVRSSSSLLHGCVSREWCRNVINTTFLLDIPQVRKLVGQARLVGASTYRPVQLSGASESNPSETNRFENRPHDRHTCQVSWLQSVNTWN